LKAEKVDFKYVEILNNYSEKLLQHLSELKNNNFITKYEVAPMQD